MGAVVRQGTSTASPTGPRSEAVRPRIEPHAGTRLCYISLLCTSTHSLSLFLPRSLSLSLSVCLSVPLSIYVSLSYQSDRVNTEPLSTFFPLSRITKPTVLKHRRVMSCVFLCLLHPAIKIKNTKARKGREQITICFDGRQHASINDS